ncbi:hypothetical protein JOB18_004957 [Solea senegalensis]|uniref:Uncharacterized protein n=1 Tax=Solea senegalensis TaxID=28829 RepID=A0AAV6R8C2_SOLSE|nr:hypothetical protein JOB18_004957 [Solea senegalensis]
MNSTQHLKNWVWAFLKSAVSKYDESDAFTGAVESPGDGTEHVGHTHITQEAEHSELPLPCSHTLSLSIWQEKFQRMSRFCRHLGSRVQYNVLWTISRGRVSHISVCLKADD